MKIEINSAWTYIGPGQGRGQIHQVKYRDDDEVITIGLPYGQGCSWLGPIEDFLKQFNYKGQLPNE